MIVGMHELEDRTPDELVLRKAGEFAPSGIDQQQPGPAIGHVHQVAAVVEQPLDHLRPVRRDFCGASCRHQLPHS